MATNGLELESASCAVSRWYVCTNLLMWSPHGRRPWKSLRSKFDTELLAERGEHHCLSVHFTCFLVSFAKQSSYAITRTFKDREFAEQALLSVEAKLFQSASPPFQRTHLQLPIAIFLPEWLLFDFHGRHRQRQRQPTPTYLRLWLR